MRIVIALGGNALLRRGDAVDADVQRANVEAAARVLAPIAREHEVILTHGNGPQVGLLALQSATGPSPAPLDVLDAESQGQIGYLLETALRNALPRREVLSVLTSVVVQGNDPAFSRPTKPIGPRYAPADAAVLANTRGWTFAADGDLRRRVVASPEPRRIVEVESIRVLVAAGILVICGGGGGTPVVEEAGRLRGVEAVIDKDLTSALLATALGAEALLLLTDVAAVERDWGTPHATPVRAATPADLRALGCPAGSMGPKVEAACRFVEATRGLAVIGALADASAMLRGDAGTRVLSLA